MSFHTPYLITISRDGVVLHNGVEHSKRESKREAKRLIREKYKGVPGIQADIEHQGFGLVFQMETYTDAAGKVRVRDLEL